MTTQTQSLIEALFAYGEPKDGKFIMRPALYELWEKAKAETSVHWDNLQTVYRFAEMIRAALTLADAAGKEDEGAGLREALRYYAEGKHMAGMEEWDNVSGEPGNWLCPPTDDGWMVEDGSIAAAALSAPPKAAAQSEPKVDWQNSETPPNCPTVEDAAPARIRWRDAQGRRCTIWASGQQIGEAITTAKAAQQTGPQVQEEAAPDDVRRDAERFKCGARVSVGANDPQECNWPMCGCDPYAGKVIAALQEHDVLKDGYRNDLAASYTDTVRRYKNLQTALIELTERERRDAAIAASREPESGK